ncbi:hypothetical protein G9A89_003509 [Geosiphon pyriformis]|nr:hypothetical protein G9A89_003509 [Geosiphon pyriformis]
MSSKAPSSFTVQPSLPEDSFPSLSFSPPRKRKYIQWTNDEDQALKTLVPMYPKEYANIAKNFFPGRSGKQIRDRWTSISDPKIDNSPLKPEEKFRILELYKTHGSKWTTISEELPGRSPSKVKEFYYGHARKNQKKKRDSKMSVEFILN